MNVCGVSFGAAFGGKARAAPCNKFSGIAMNLSKNLGVSLVLVISARGCIIKEGVPMDASFDFGVRE